LRLKVGVVNKPTGDCCENRKIGTVKNSVKEYEKQENLKFSNADAGDGIPPMLTLQFNVQPQL